jgi:phenylalanine-4-hydroxylase
MKKTKYIAKKPDINGNIHYTDIEHNTWKHLYERQVPLIQELACEEYLKGLELLNLNPHKIPQCHEMNQTLQATTGWKISPVEALISFEKFFKMLSQKTFPAASFIRIPEELDYLQEPDIFHEIFGHCPMLTLPEFADFTEEIGHFGLTLDKIQRSMLARLYWFTVEFGLIKTNNKLRIYGGGILSSKGESKYAIESPTPKRIPFDLLTVLRTPYRYDEMQKTYFILEDFSKLYTLCNRDKLLSVFKETLALGLFDDPHATEITDHRSC